MKAAMRQRRAEQRKLKCGEFSCEFVFFKFAAKVCIIKKITKYCQKNQYFIRIKNAFGRQNRRENS
jgi:hypothetical protein